MNKLYCLLLALVLVAPLGVRAQQADSLRLRLDHVLAPLDKSQVPTRLLADYAVPLARLTSFDGTLADSTRTTPLLFRALYATAATACIYGTNPLLDLPTYNQRVAAVEATSETLIPVMVQRVDYARLRPDAVSQNLLSVQNGQLYDVPGRAQSPYQARTLFAAAPSRERASSATVRLVLPQSLYVAYGTSLPNLVAREVDFGDGRGYLPVAWDQPLTATYATAGVKRIKIRFTYQRKLASATSYESQFDLYVPAPAASSASIAARTQGGALLANDSVTFNAQPGRAAGKAYIHYADGRTSLVKPLIVLEGYDKHFIAPHIEETNY